MAETVREQIARRVAYGLEPETIDVAIWELMKEYGPTRLLDGQDGRGMICEYVLLLLAAEREACAKIADEHSSHNEPYDYGHEIAAKIRARAK